MSSFYGEMITIRKVIIPKKCVLRESRVLQKNRDIKNLSNSELFYEIAERQNLAIVKKNSSISFARFHDDYISLLRSEMLWAVRFQDLT